MADHQFPAEMADQGIERSAIEALCQSMCGVIGGNFSVRLSTGSDDLTVQKTALLTNFMLESAQRAVARSRSYADALSNVQRIMKLSAWRISHPDGLVQHIEADAAVARAPAQRGLGWFLEQIAPDYRNSVEALFVQEGGAVEWPNPDQSAWFRTEVLPEHEAGLVAGFLVITQDISENRRAAERIHYLANHDPLTGLANRRRLQEQLTASLALSRRYGSQFAVHVLDLDRFKTVNDLYGHAAGDRLLIDLAACLTGEVRDCDMVARMGGDEFVILQTDIASAADASSLAERLTGKVRNLLEHTDYDTLMPTVSIGIALAPADGDTAEALISHADMALYQVKSASRNGFAFFNTTINNTQLARDRMTADLRRARERGEFEVVYQPLLDVARNEVLGFEALLRWHRAGGDVPPDIFIPLAEESGHILEIGTYVLREACRAAVSWAVPLHVAVNISAVQVQKGRLPELVAQILAETGLATHRLELEVTESMLLADVDAAIDVLNQLRALGVRVSLDDFGTGYSSLATLRSFPFDKLKLDRRFVQDLGADARTEAVIAAVLDLGRALGLNVVAEGVETEIQAASLREAGCQVLQGYLIGRPRPIAHYGNLTSGIRPD